MGELTAIFISVITFLFTMYQWLFAMNSRRPKLAAPNFKPLNIEHNQDYGFFDIIMPLDLFIINLSELPNSILDMKLFAKIGKNWLEGKFVDYNRWNPAQAKQNPFPVLIQGHTYFKLGGKEGKYPFVFEFQGNPSREDWVKLSLRLEIHDQYGKVHATTITRRKHFPKMEIQPYVSFQGQQILDKWDLLDPNDTSSRSIYRVVYQPEYTVNNILNPTISFQRYWRYSGSGSDMMSINRYYLNQEHKDWATKEGKFLYKDSLSYTPSGLDVKVYLLMKNGLPQEMEIEMTAAERVITKTIALPEGFVQSLNKPETK